MSQQVQLGTSGAVVIHEGGGCVRKTGFTDTVVQRVVAQGVWLRERANVRGLPRVYQVLDDGYTMHEYRPLPTSRDATSTLKLVYHTLRETLWRSHGTWNPICQDYFQRYVSKLVARDLPNVGNALLMFIAADFLKHCTPCDAHGDPTLDNVMIDDLGEIVLIDPIPSYHGSPELRAVDLGKLLQSAFGYELVKYQDVRWAIDIDEILDEFAQFEREVDLRAALFFCAVHYLRLIPYQLDEVKRETYRKIATALCVRIRS